MSIAWLNAAAWWGLGLIAIPIAIHLLVRQQTRVVHYPSLRFVRATALAAFRRRAIQDALLLACRIAIVIAAVAALAGPVMQTAARMSRYSDRVSVAVVQLDDTVTAARETANAYRAQTFRRANISDTINDALRWLDAQPPSSREMAFVGAFRKGQVSQSDLHNVPAEIGIRFLGAPAAPGRDQFAQAVLTTRNGQLVFASREVRLDAGSTRVASGQTTPAPQTAVRIVASPKDQPLADAALNAAIEEGVRWPNRERRVVVLWEGGASPGNGTEILRMPVPEPASTAATAVWNALEDSTPIEAAEPLTIARADLDAWSRTPGGVSPTAQPADEGDRRWLWAIALALLAVEHLLRRDRSQLRESHLERDVA